MPAQNMSSRDALNWNCWAHSVQLTHLLVSKRSVMLLYNKKKQLSDQGRVQGQSLGGKQDKYRSYKA